MSSSTTIPSTPSLARHKEMIRNDILLRFQNGDPVDPSNVDGTHTTVQSISELCIERMVAYHKVKEEKSQLEGQLKSQKRQFESQIEKGKTDLKKYTLGTLVVVALAVGAGIVYSKNN